LGIFIGFPASPPTPISATTQYSNYVGAIITYFNQNPWNNTLTKDYGATEIAHFIAKARVLAGVYN